MLDDLTAEEIIVLVQLLKTTDDAAMIFNENDELTFLRNVPAAITLAEKISQTADREDVKKLLLDRYGSTE